ncbi:MAG TPA: NUMOD4 domain-containing protein [Planctomycetota bacterium]|jgi:hypothetical protein
MNPKLSPKISPEENKKLKRALIEAAYDMKSPNRPNYPEIWKPIPDWEHYQVSNWGRVRRMTDNYDRPLKTPRILPNPHGFTGGSAGNRRHKMYFITHLSHHCEVTTVLIHRLVARAFLGEPKGIKTQVNHKDCEPLAPWGNRLSNLEFVTPRGQLRHEEESGKTTGRILTPRQIIRLRQLRAKGYPAVFLAKKYDVGLDTVTRIATGRAWKQIGGPLTNNGKTSERWKWDKQFYRRVHRLFSQGLSRKEIAEIVGMSSPTVSRVLKH